MSNDTILTTQNELSEITDVDNTSQVECNNSCIKLFNDDIQELNNKIRDVEYDTNRDIDALHDLIYTISQQTSNKISELNIDSTAHSQHLSSQEKRIETLEDAAVEHNEKLKQSWVRVMSTKEYNKLVVAPEGAPYNDRYIYPNTLYFIVDYNKPKAVYIGDILIAKAEGKGPNGFAYNFPISF